MKRKLGIDEHGDYYRVYVYCANCGASGTIYVKNGVEKPHTAVECATCLCRTARPGL